METEKRKQKKDKLIYMYPNCQEVKRDKIQKNYEILYKRRKGNKKAV